MNKKIYSFFIIVGVLGNYGVNAAEGENWFGIPQDELDSHLLQAIKDNNIEEAEAVILFGANVNNRDIHGNTTLIEAIRYRARDIIALLIENDANVNARNLDGDTALMVAARQGYSDGVELLVVSGAKVNVRNLNGENACMQAAQELHLYILEFFLLHTRAIDDLDSVLAVQTAVRNFPQMPHAVNMLKICKKRLLRPFRSIEE